MLYIFFFISSLMPLCIYRYYGNFIEHKNNIYRKYQDIKDYIYICYINYKCSKNSQHSDYLSKDDSVPFELKNNNKIKILRIETKNENEKVDAEKVDIKKIEDILHRIFHPEDYNDININTNTRIDTNVDTGINTSDDNIYVTYNYGNDIYRMCVKHLDFKPTGSEIGEPKQIIWAYLKKNDGSILEVTDIIKMYQGPSCDFHTKIQGISNKLVDIFSHTNTHTHTHTSINDKEDNQNDKHGNNNDKHEINLKEWNHLHIENFYEEIVIDIDINTLHDIELQA